MTWDPIIEGELAARARSVLAEVCDGLAGAAGPSHEHALFWTYATASLDDDPALAARAQHAMVRFADELGHALPESLALHGGLTGWAWVAAHVAEGVEPLLAAVDRGIFDALAAPWTRDYDLILGLAGFATYLLERTESPVAVEALARVVAQLEATAIRRPDGIAWFTAPAIASPLHRERYPHGYYNCGLAHGVPGVVAALSRIIGHPTLPAATRATAIELRDGAANWVLAQHLRGQDFPAAMGGPPSRTAWCYGDPGVAVALWDAVSPASRDDLAFGWIARDAIGVHDAAICHGSAGLAHLANRMFHATRDVRYRDAARRWIADTLDRHRPGTGIGGYTMARAGEPLLTTSLVEGTIGTALVLLAALAPIEPLWDRLFLCDLSVID